MASIKPNLYSQAFRENKHNYLEQAQALDAEFDKYREFLEDLEKQEVTVPDATAQSHYMKYDMCSLKLFVDDVDPASLQDAYYSLDINNQPIQEGKFYQGVDILNGSILPFFTIACYSSPLVTVRTRNGHPLKVRAVIEYIKLPGDLLRKWRPETMCIPWERYRNGIYTGECLLMACGATCIRHIF
jgi:hypothetical protein